MGYTHYWTQRRDHSKAQWTQICEDITAILKDVQHVQGIPLAFEEDQPTRQPQIDAETIRFNGLGDDGHETFLITRKRAPLEDWQSKDRRGWAFCKTARKPYDLAVTACLAYLAALEEHPWVVTSDGDGVEWLDGVELAKRVVSRLGNTIDIPLSIMKGDRWDWRNRAVESVMSAHYDVRTCLDGAVYVYDVRDESRCYRFPTVEEARGYFARFNEKPCTVRFSDGATFREGGRPLFNASGSFDKSRRRAIDRAQSRILKALIDGAAVVGRNQRPPLFARPLVMPAVAREQANLADLYQLCA